MSLMRYQYHAVMIIQRLSFLLISKETIDKVMYQLGKKNGREN